MQSLPVGKGVYALVDDEDFERVRHLSWRASARRQRFGVHQYVQRTVRVDDHRTTEYLHRLIVNAMPGDYVDHINGDTLDCRKVNLRICTHSQNLANTKRFRSSRNPYKGIWMRDGCRWCAGIRSNGKKIYLGSFLTPEDAAIAYDEAARMFHGEFARVNFPRSGERAAN